MNNEHAKPVALDETKAVASYFRGDARYGRTTTLVVRASGGKLVEVMGPASRGDCYRAYVAGLSR